MRKNFGAKTYLYPMPVFIVAAYDENGVPNAMNAAWGGICDDNRIALCLSADHKTTENIKARGAFTVNIADAAHVGAGLDAGNLKGDGAPDLIDRAVFVGDDGVEGLG